jgi:hypothetical protein
MKLLLLLILALPLFAKQSEMYYQEEVAWDIGGQVEMVMKDVTGCDILAAAYAIEVDFAVLR